MKIKPASEMVMWAVVIRNPRSEWIWYPSIARLRKEALNLYMEGSSDADRSHTRKELKTGRIRLARVRVSLFAH